MCFSKTELCFHCAQSLICRKLSSIFFDSICVLDLSGTQGTTVDAASHWKGDALLFSAKISILLCFTHTDVKVTIDNRLIYGHRKEMDVNLLLLHQFFPPSMQTFLLSLSIKPLALALTTIIGAFISCTSLCLTPWCLFENGDLRSVEILITKAGESFFFNREDLLLLHLDPA